MPPSGTHKYTHAHPLRVSQCSSPIFYASLEPCKRLKKGLFQSLLGGERDPWPSLYMNNPCVFSLVRNERTLCLNAYPIKHQGGEEKGRFFKGQDSFFFETHYTEIVLVFFFLWFSLLVKVCFQSFKMLLIAAPPVHWQGHPSPSCCAPWGEAISHLQFRISVCLCACPCLLFVL